MYEKIFMYLQTQLHAHFLWTASACYPHHSNHTAILAQAPLKFTSENVKILVLMTHFPNIYTNTVIIACAVDMALLVL